MWSWDPAADGLADPVERGLRDGAAVEGWRIRRVLARWTLWIRRGPGRRAQPWIRTHLERGEERPVREERRWGLHVREGRREEGASGEGFT